MACEIILAALWVLSSAARPALAAGDFTAPEGLSDIRADARQLAQEAASHQARVVIVDADLDVPDLAARGWKDDDLVALAQAIGLGSQAVQALHGKNPSAAAAAYDSVAPRRPEDIAKIFSLLDDESQRSCRLHQKVVSAALSGLRDVLEVHQLVIGQGLEHRAVIVYPKGRTDWKEAGVVLDGWLGQSHVPRKMTFTFRLWQANLEALRYLKLDPIVFQAGPRLED